MASNLQIGPVGSVTGTSFPKERSQESDLSTTANSDQLRRIKNIHQAELQGEKISISDAQLMRAIERAIKAMEGPYTMFEVSVHEKTNAVMVKVLDRDSGDLIREIPPEKTLDLVAKMMEFAGILIDERR
ncbi:flagellar protein FlaG [Paenibacillus sp. J2TS4]|uniref:flagellar protein FlaG n=1 Tax=Paenibacillus sp. J2TS4 TaxID=2807194 RepID=UPI001B170DCD|nr:flagellar protein FlaG [Paenibacillus sp. J2TS4]GIP35612.1 hypothetical protein J2TS4_48220 [Paenibacillus sp. J2TS4]